MKKEKEKKETPVKPEFYHNGTIDSYYGYRRPIFEKKDPYLLKPFHHNCTPVQ